MMSNIPRSVEVIRLQTVYADYTHGPNMRPLATHNPVLGTWPLNPIAVLVGEAPGSTEIQTGQPFTGRAGQRLTTHLDGFRDRCGVTNIVKLRPTRADGRDRPPTQAEIAESMPYFWRELSLMGAPSTRLICAMGRIAASAVLQADIRVSEIHGHWIKRPIEDPGGEKWLVYVTYHPAAVLHNPELDEVLHEDLTGFATDVGMYGRDTMDIVARLG